MLSKADAAVQPIDYPVLAGGPLRGIEPAMAVAELPARTRETEAERAEAEQHHARQVEAARREGVEQGKSMAAADQAAWRKQLALEVAGAIEDFRRRRDEYLAQVEHEVVQLALAIAERILHREAQMDPLLLAGAVRVALGRLADSTEVRLRIPAEQKDLWGEMLRLMPNQPLRPEVIADAGMHDCEAVLETSLGRVDLGVRVQIEEIERGFFDLLDVRNGKRQA